MRVEHALSTVLDPDWIQPSLIDIRKICGPDGLRDKAYLAEAKKHAVFDPIDQAYKTKDHRVVIPKVTRTKLLAMAHPRWSRWSLRHRHRVWLSQRRRCMDQHARGQQNLRQLMYPLHVTTRDTPQTPIRTTIARLRSQPSCQL